jgi:mRNA interferase RelE/StbE
MYSVKYKKSVEKELRALQSGVRVQIVQKIQALGTNPRPDGSTKIRGADNVFRVRYLSYRVIYRVDDGQLTILVVKVGHRREVYRDL